MAAGQNAILAGTGCIAMAESPRGSRCVRRAVGHPCRSGDVSDRRHTHADVLDLASAVTLLALRRAEIGGRAEIGFDARRA
jgi:hypothetical protein